MFHKSVKLSNVLFLILLYCFGAFVIYGQVVRNVKEETLYLSNMDERCIRCLCRAATSCNLTLGCIAGYCGPFKVSRVYWVDAGRPVMPEDDPERAGAYQDCALSYPCAIRMVKLYIAKFGRDCNNDGITNCDDFSMINFNGGYQCLPALNRSQAGTAWQRRYDQCSKGLEGIEVLQRNL